MGKTLRKVLSSGAEQKWVSGKDANPPFPGWWCASPHHCSDYWRYWNGKFWSLHATRDLPIAAINARSYTPAALRPDEMDWCDFWPTHNQQGNPMQRERIPKA